PDGGTIRSGGPGEGWVVLPTVGENAPPTPRVCREEVFGPVVTVTAFDTDSEAIAQANDTPYGLNAMVFTENLSRAHRASAALKAGTVWVNCFFVRDLRAPFGGVGDSGIGREGGNFSREFFTAPKAVVMQVWAAAHRARAVALGGTGRAAVVPGDLVARGQPGVRLGGKVLQRLVEVFRPERLAGHEGVQRQRHDPAAASGVGA